MATENPILMGGNNERWGNSRQGSGSVPNRSGSAPPSIEGSFLAVDNLLSRHASGSAYSSKVKLNRILSPPIYLTENNEVMNDVDVGRFKSSPGLGLYKVNSPIHLSQPTLSTHKEVSKNQTSQPQSLNTLLSDRTDGDGVISGLMEISLSPDSQRFSGFRQDNISSDMTPQHSRSNSLNGEINTADENSNLSEMSDDAKYTMVKDKAASSSKGIPSLLRESTGTDIENTSDESSISSKLKKTNISGTTTRENKYPQETRNHQFNLSERQLHGQRNNISGIQGVKRGSHVANDSIAGTFGQSVLQSSGFTPPLYATTQMAYLTSPNYVYNMQSPGVYCPQYGYGYGSCTLTPNMISQSQFVPGYPSHGSVPLIFRPDFVPQSSGTSMGNVVHGGELQYAEKLYVPPEQPSFPDPMYLQYCQQSFGQAYNTPGQMNLLPPRGVAPGNHKYTPDSQNDETMGLNYYGILPNMGILVQYLPTQLGPPLSPGSTPYVETYPAWQHQGGLGGAKGPRLYNFLEELKSGKGRRFDLCDIAGHIVEFSADQHGSRFIQQKLENCNPDEKAAVFREVVPHACKLMTDVFGNYVIQRFFEYGTSGQRKELADQLMGQIVPLSLQMYGCRVIQKALDVIEVDQRVRLARELDGQVMRCVRDQNGNHVIQKCIESIPTDRIGFILSAFHGQVSSLSMHPYGCRVIQRLLERCSNEHQCRFITEEILESVCLLSKDQYGNYVTQYVLEKGRAEERERIVRKLSGHIVQLSLHKFASNVIEKCLEHGGRIERDLIIKEIAGVNESYDSLLMMMKDQYGNYVVQKIFETCTVDQRSTLLSRVKTHASALKKYTYGKHIVTRLEQPFSKESQEMR